MNDLKFLSTSEFLIPSSTGEYLPKNITTVYDVSDLEDSNPELADELSDNGIQLIYSINIKEAHQAYEELLKKLLNILHEDFIGNSDFYEDIPDLINQLQHIAFCYNHNCEEDQLPLLYPQSIIKNFDKGRGNLKDSLQDQCNFCNKDGSPLIIEQSIIHRVVKVLVNKLSRTNYLSSGLTTQSLTV